MAILFEMAKVHISGSEAGNFYFTSKCQKYFIKGSASKTALRVLNK